MANEQGSGENHGATGKNHGATGSERIGDSGAKKETYKPGETYKSTEKSTTSKSESYRQPDTGTTRSGATSSERVAAPKKGFNPAWLLVPAAGLLLGGLGIANMNRKPEVKVPAVPSVSVAVPSVTVPSVDVTVPTVPGVTASADAAAAGCNLAFTNTTVERPLTRLKNIVTGQYLNAPTGKRFVVVNTTLRNSGGGTCMASPGSQRTYSGSSTFFEGSQTAGDELYRGRRMTKAISDGNSVRGAYVFEVPTGTTLNTVRMRADDTDNWTVVRVR